MAALTDVSSVASSALQLASQEPVLLHPASLPKQLSEGKARLAAGVSLSMCEMWQPAECICHHGSLLLLRAVALSRAGAGSPG